MQRVPRRASRTSFPIVKRLGASAGFRTDGTYITSGLVFVFSQCSHRRSAMLRSLGEVVPLTFLTYARVVVLSE
ncbi:hypothetical protein AYI70_g7046 [Smittium culicis]|uniref:Uncharacterized protein n=1 Tax=Smittium culicis TaxID=133412 RepID=A0A1R1XM98_9FUNG|nr:hypothetical protein AYI70_g7046 [Smittium culicis]